MRSWLLALIVVAAFTGGALAQEDKKTDDLKPADPDTGESGRRGDSWSATQSIREAGRQVRCDLHRGGPGQSHGRSEAGRRLRTSEKLQGEGAGQEAKGDSQQLKGHAKNAVKEGVNKVADAANKKL